MTKGEKIQILDNAINLTYKLLEKAYKEGRDVNEIKTTVDILSYLECYADSLKSRPGEQEGEKEFSIAEAHTGSPRGCFCFFATKNREIFHKISLLF